MSKWYNVIIESKTTRSDVEMYAQSLEKALERAENRAKNLTVATGAEHEVTRVALKVTHGTTK
ncbi:hypothetical protein [Pasteurella phage vB_PmuP_PS07]|uniref:Uncharacterized protein n=2 Tax=Wuhanvirus PHB02 TaxID=2733970 RepID=A0A7G8ZYP7_9CAUD|nr:RNA polymerase inhibitor [Pasteurella phage vB_PmuP_PHB02]ARV77598.1 hypothetical protein [Pasteurella phage vB_PmuP_PHB02]QNL29328.1 hypothetical protein [Pasteurella phage vB_PmuP_Pa7]UIS73854.1 hypothetical protein [Pasteurella phage vB_PmuP_PS07]UIS74028.1 hypothetical protein [Pasteurella phage vB_PmuP_PS30]